MARTLSRARLTLLLALSAAAVAPAPALALDRYVDASTGVDADEVCSQEDPCASLDYALTFSNPGDQVLVDDGSYPGTATIEDGRSVAYQNFVDADGPGPAIVDGGASTALTVAASGAGHIRGLTVRSNASAQMTLNGAAEVDSNTFDDPDAIGTVTGVQVNASGSDIHHNLFIDPAPGSTRGRIGAVSLGGTTVTVRDNTFTGLNLAVQVDGGNSVVGGNDVTGTHNQPGAGRSLLVGGAGAVTVRENSISAAVESLGSVTGISAGSGSALVRNEVTGHGIGVQVVFDQPDVSLAGDRIWGNSFDGLSISEANADPPHTSVSASNVTIVENAGADIRNDSILTLDSSIIEDYFPAGTASCTITFSRADTDPNTHPSNCDDFQTTADPMLVDPDNGNLHLQLGSPMADMGNPAAPAAGAVDFDGDPRALDATPECSGNVARRDIGADEFNRGPPDDCDPPDTTFTETPPNKTDRRKVEFEFEADEDGTFTCKLDDKAPVACTSPWERKVKVGRHVVRVRATDNDGNVEEEPAKDRFRRVAR